MQTGIPRAAVAATFGAILALASAQTAWAEGTIKIHGGEAVAVGKGTARTTVALNTAGEPVSIAVVLKGKVLEGLPEATADHHDWEYILPMPKGISGTGYDHVGLNWNPVGHDPSGIYSVPHFDVHFYLIGKNEREAITFKGERAADAKIPPAAKTLPKGYVAPPETAVEQMGIHAVNPGSPEFRGKPFTATFIYGYHKGRLIFVEPMISKAFLEAKRDVTQAVTVPEVYSLPAYYPSRWRAGYDAKTDQHTIALTGLRRWDGRQGAYLTPQAAPIAFNAAVKPLRE